MIIDFHVHCFADKIAAKAIGVLEEKSGLKTIHDGTIQGLKSYMRSHGVDRSVVLPVATNPGQVPVINKWAKESADTEVYFFGAVHPDDADFPGTVQWLKANGFRGVKMHPDYQLFYADEARMMPLYEALRDAGLILALHCGLDNVYPVPMHCSPQMVRNIIHNIPGINIIAAHMGGHVVWRDAEELLLGLPLYIDTSYSQYALSPADMKRMIKKHGSERVLFGTDSPWKHADEEIRMIDELDLPKSDIDNILYKNALALLG
jgi:predicted TIM-barrel fold metal-dependent hydrolase